MELNIELLTKVSNWLKAGAPEDQAHGFHFDMWNWLEIQTQDNKQGWCGTACCIAGAALVFGDFEYVRNTAEIEIEGFGFEQPVDLQDGVDGAAAEALGLTQHQAERLFEPWSFFNIQDHITPAQAAEVIDHLIETGEVRW